MLTSPYSFFFAYRPRLQAFAILIIGLVSMTQLSAQGTWTMLTNPSPDQNFGVMLLLSDGSVICKTSNGGNDGNGTIWDRLTPDSHGSYVNGTWSRFNPMINSRLYFASQVMTDGRVFVAGGEYGTGGSNAEVFDPTTNVWTAAPYTGQYFGDANSEILPNGNLIVGVLTDSFYPYTTALYNPETNSWIPGGAPTLNSHDESSWVKLPDGSILYVDLDTTTSERFIPSLGQWVADATVPVSLYDPIESETGPGFLLPDGRAFFLGSPGHTAYYTPSGNTSPGSWAAGPDIPSGYGCADASGAMMDNGIILFTAAPIPTAASTYASPTVYFEFNYLTNTFSQVSAPPGANNLSEASYVTNFLDLPDGNIMYAEFGSNHYWVYTPGSAPLASGKPTIDTVYQNSCDSFTVTGTLFNGITEGAAYGDDWQMATNYPIVRLTQGSNVYYARSFNWSSTGVQTGSTPDTTRFVLPAGIPAGTYALAVIANGNSSAPVSFTTPLLPHLTSALAPPAICSGTLFTYAASASAGAAYTWTRDSISGISNSAVTVPQTSNPNEVLVNTTLSPLTVLYNYTITDNVCSIIEQVAETVNSLPDTGYITVYGSTSLCIGNYLSLSDNVSGNSSIVWSVTGDTTTYENVTQGGDYYVTNTNVCGTDTSNHIQVTSLPYQAPTVLLNGLGNDTFCLASAPIVVTGTPLGGILVFNSYDTLTNGSLFFPFNGYLGNNSFFYSYTDSNGCSNFYNQNMFLEDSCVDTSLAVKNIAGNTVSFMVFPNPASDLINIKADGLTSGYYILSLSNIEGQAVSVQQINVIGNMLNTQLNIQSIPTGIYFLSLSSETVRETIKVVKY